MEYLTSKEIRLKKESVKDKLAMRSAEGQLGLKLKGRNVHIFEQAVADKNSRILDFGTGSAAFIEAIYKKGYRNVAACDIDDYVAEECKRLLKDFQTLDANYQTLKWPKESFDAVTAWEVFEHLENPHNAVREIHRILKPQGLLIFSVPNIFHIISRLVFLKRGLFPRWNESNNHISVYPHGIFEKAFLRYFDLLKEGYVHAKISLPILSAIKFLPENQWFGNWVYYILRKK